MTAPSPRPGPARKPGHGQPCSLTSDPREGAEHSAGHLPGASREGAAREQSGAVGAPFPPHGGCTPRRVPTCPRETDHTPCPPVTAGLCVPRFPHCYWPRVRPPRPEGPSSPECAPGLGCREAELGAGRWAEGAVWVAGLAFLSRPRCCRDVSRWPSWAWLPAGAPRGAGQPRGPGGRAQPAVTAQSPLGRRASAAAWDPIKSFFIVPCDGSPPPGPGHADNLFAEGKGAKSAGEGNAIIYSAPAAARALPGAA